MTFFWYNKVVFTSIIHKVKLFLQIDMKLAQFWDMWNNYVDIEGNSKV